MNWSWSNEKAPERKWNPLTNFLSGGKTSKDTNPQEPLDTFNRYIEGLESD